MAWAFIILVVLAAWHYLWDSIFAPAMRASLRFELFRLRDEVRSLLADSSDLDHARLQSLHGTLNAAIRILPGVRISSLHECYTALQADPELHAKIEERIVFINSASNPRVRMLHEGVAFAVYRAFLTNSGGWLFIVAPIAFFVRPVGWLYRAISDLATLTEKEVDSRFPQLLTPEPA